MSVVASRIDSPGSQESAEPIVSEPAGQGFWPFIVRSLWTAAFMGCVSAIFAFIFLLALNAFVPRRPQAALWPIFAVPAIGFVMASVLSLPVVALQYWRSRARRISATWEHFIVDAPSGTQAYPWDSCVWTVASTLPFDSAGAYPPGRPRIIVTYQPPPSRLEELRAYACGHSDESFMEWFDWLTSRRVERLDKAPMSTLIFRLACPSTAGGLIGMVATSLFDPLIGPGGARFLGLLGWLDGLVLGVYWHYLMSAGSRRLERARYARREGLVVFAIGFAKIGLLTGAAGGWQCALAACAANAALGALLLWILAQRIGVQTSADETGGSVSSD